MPGGRTSHSVLPTAEMGTARNSTQIMTKELAVETKEAVYFFFIYPQMNIAHVTKLVRKDADGYDQSTSLSVDGARKLYKRLVTA